MYHFWPVGKLGYGWDKLVNGRPAKMKGRSEEPVRAPKPYNENVASKTNHSVVCTELDKYK